jgi:hypothetical protein
LWPRWWISTVRLAASPDPKGDLRKRAEGIFGVSNAGGGLHNETAGNQPALRRRLRGTDMRQIWTLSTCFEHFGAVRSHRHFGGSAVSGDGATVVVAMWEDEIVRHGGRVTYRSRFGPALKGKSQRVSVQWVTHLKWALSHCGGCVRVVVLTAEDARASPRVVRSCYPDDSLIMRITDFDPKTGFFSAHTF